MVHNMPKDWRLQAVKCVFDQGVQDEGQKDAGVENDSSGHIVSHTFSTATAQAQQRKAL